jgi:hypothetical protein
MALRPQGLDKSPQESDEAYLARLQGWIVRQNAEQEKAAQHERNILWLALAAGIIAVIVGILIGYGLWNNPKEVDRISAENVKLSSAKTKLEGELAAEKAKKPEPLACVTSKQLEETVKVACTGKTETTIRYRDRPVSRGSAGQSSASAVAKATGPGAKAEASAGGATATATVVDKAGPAPSGAADLLQAPSSAIWLWHPHTASSASPQPCVIESGNGAGLPPRCSSFTVVARKAGETKHQWLLRVGGGRNPTDTGLYQKL